MKNITILINIALVTLNIAITAAMIKMFTLGYLVQYCVMLIIFIPLLVQLICACIFFFIVVPLRQFHTRGGNSANNKKGHNSDQYYDRRTKDDMSVNSLRFTEVYCKSEDTWDYGN